MCISHDETDKSETFTIVESWGELCKKRFFLYIIGFGGRKLLEIFEITTYSFGIEISCLIISKLQKSNQIK